MSTIRSIARYADHFKKAKGRYRIHSPFVYDLLCNCIRSKGDAESYEGIERVVEQLRKDRSVIPVKDLGAGSKWTRRSERRVDRIAKHSGCDKKSGRLLHRLAARFAEREALELGTSLGIGTMYLGKGAKGKLHSIEGCPGSHSLASENLKKADVRNVEVHRGEFREVLKELLPSMNALDLVRIDGDHREAATLEYFELCMKKAHNDTLFIFDDIHWSKGMERAWQGLKDDPRVTLTLDLFSMGLVFLRSEQREPLHLKIRF